MPLATDRFPLELSPSLLLKGPPSPLDKLLLSCFCLPLLPPPPVAPVDELLLRCGLGLAKVNPPRTVRTPDITGGRERTGNAAKMNYEIN